MTTEVVQKSQSAGKEKSEEPVPVVSTADRDLGVPRRDEDMPAEFDQYARFSGLRKGLITTTVSYCGLMASISSMLVLSAIPEIAADLNTTSTMIGLSNALYQMVTALGPILWGPISRVYGRKMVCLYTAVLFTLFSLGTALAPNLAAFFAFRMLTAFEGICFFVVGSSCIRDIYHPTQRARALAWFFFGTLVGPAFGPFVGGIIVTYYPWRSIFWLQTAVTGFGTLLIVAFLPETIEHKLADDLQGLPRTAKAKQLWAWINPSRVVALLRYPNLMLVHLASSALTWTQMSLLTPIRIIMNPRFHLQTPLEACLFFLAPGLGLFAGAFIGGRYADATLKKWTDYRGERVPEDRLKSALLSLGVVTPACMLIYGWSIDREVGGIPLPVICMFIQGIAQMICFSSLNPYCLDVMSDRSSETIAGNYFVRYLFGAAGTAACIPAIESMGVGWFSTITSLLAMASAGGLYLVTVRGPSWRAKVQARKREAV